MWDWLCDVCCLWRLLSGLAAQSPAFVIVEILGRGLMQEPCRPGDSTSWVGDTCLTHPHPSFPQPQAWVTGLGGATWRVTRSALHSRFVLAVGSAVFDAMFNGGMATTSTEIELPDVEPAAFLALLK